MAKLVFLSFLAVSLCAGETILVAHKWADSVGIYDAGSGQSIAVIPVGKKPHELALSPDLRLAYVTNYGLDLYTETAPGGNTLSIVDLKLRQTIGEIDLGKFRRPHGIERGASGKLYVTCDLPPSLVVVDPLTRRILRSIDVGQALPHMVALTEREDKAYTVNSGAGTVTAIDLRAGKAVKHIRIDGVPMGLALSPDGRRVYAANRTGDAVAVIDTRRDQLITKIQIPGQPVRLLLTPDKKHLLVSLIEAGDLAVLSLETNKVVRRFHAGARVEGMGVDAAGRFGYISAQADDKVVKFSLADWKPVLEIKTAARPDPIAVLP
jgi:YVTN family beta-propeller protein